MSTDGGLSRFDPKTKNFTNYYEADGLAGSAFEGFPVACRSRRGQMFFGSKYGLTSFWPEQIIENPSVPPCGHHGILATKPASGAGLRLAAHKIHHVYAILDAVSRAEPVLVRVCCLELRGSGAEPVPVHARGIRPLLESGGRRSPAGNFYDLTWRLHASDTGLEQSLCGVSRGLRCASVSCRLGGPHGGFAASARSFSWRCWTRLTRPAFSD